MLDWREKQRALRKYEHDAPARTDKRDPRSVDSSIGAPVGGPGSGGRPGGAAAAVPVTAPVDESSGARA